MLGSNILKKAILSKLLNTVRVIKNHTFQEFMQIKNSNKKNIKKQQSFTLNHQKLLKKLL